MAHEQTVLVRFEDVDFARVVFFPRLFEYCHRVFEDFFPARLGVPYAQLVAVRKVGFPVVSSKADFRLPFRFGDECRIQMEALQIGEASIACRYRLFRGDALAAEIENVVACIDVDAFRPRPIPDDVRRGFETILAA
jgi:4-hydroxybenzoyl-CoA thioesterase